MIDESTAFSQAIALYREYAGLTQQQLAKLSGCSKTQITRMESNRFHEIRATRYVLAVHQIITQATGIELNIEHLLNHSAQSNSKTKHRGVCYIPERKKYIATIGAFGERFYLGRYDTLFEAIRIRSEAENKLGIGLTELKSWISNTILQQDKSL